MALPENVVVLEHGPRPTKPDPRGVGAVARENVVEASCRRCETSGYLVDPPVGPQPVRVLCAACGRGPETERYTFHEEEAMLLADLVGLISEGQGRTALEIADGKADELDRIYDRVVEPWIETRGQTGEEYVEGGA